MSTIGFLPILPILSVVVWLFVGRSLTMAFVGGLGVMTLNGAQRLSSTSRQEPDSTHRFAEEAEFQVI
jgi:hypothetical protein